MQTLRARIVVMAACALLGACAPMVAGDSYRPVETMRQQVVELGVVEGTRAVRIEAPDSGAGTVGGAVVGGVVGNQIGRGSGNAIATIGGVILGALAGNAIERDANRRNGVEVTVRLDSGRMVAIVQGDAGEGFRPGDRVRVLSDGYATRVTR